MLLKSFVISLGKGTEVFAQHFFFFSRYLLAPRVTLGMLLLLFLGTMSGCKPQPKPTASLAPVGSAKVVAPDRIYFKNIRASRYQTADDHNNHLTVYIHDKLVDVSEGWQLSLTDDWINDRAWLSFKTDAPGLFYRLGAEDEEISLLDYKQYSDIEAIQTFASRLAASYEICYRQLASQAANCLPAGSPIRLAMRETILDFLRLTDQDK